MFGRKKLIDENLKLKNKIEVLEIDIKHYKEKENARLNGEHIPSATCKGCKHLIEERDGLYTHQYCALNNECNDMTPVE